MSANAFWLDLDCGEAKADSGKGYSHIAAAHVAVTAFLESTKLPVPTHVVNSGGGLHVYWVFDKPLQRDEWQVTAGKLKALTHALGLLADDSRTSDIASVLRVPGTLNFKYDPPRPVALLQKSAPVVLASMLDAIEVAHTRHCEVAQPLGLEATKKSFGETILTVAQPAPDLKRLGSALIVLDPDCDDETWKLKRLAPLARAGRDHPTLATRLRALAMSWSSGELRGTPSVAWKTPGQSNGITGEDIFDVIWQRFSKDDFTGTPATLGTVFHDAKQVGWVDKNAPIPFALINDGEVKPEKLVEAEATILTALEATQGGDVGVTGLFSTALRCPHGCWGAFFYSFFLPSQGVHNELAIQVSTCLLALSDGRRNFPSWEAPPFANGRLAALHV